MQPIDFSKSKFDLAVQEVGPKNHLQERLLIKKDNLVVDSIACKIIKSKEDRSLWDQIDRTMGKLVGRYVEVEIKQKSREGEKAINILLNVRSACNHTDLTPAQVRAMAKTDKVDHNFDSQFRAEIQKNPKLEKKIIKDTYKRLVTLCHRMPIKNAHLASLFEFRNNRFKEGEIVKAAVYQDHDGKFLIRFPEEGAVSGGEDFKMWNTYVLRQKNNFFICLQDKGDGKVSPELDKQTRALKNALNQGSQLSKADMASKA